MRVLLLCWLLLAVPAFAHLDLQKVSVTPIADTSLFETVPDNNMGGVSNLVVGANQQLKKGRALLRFDVARLLPTNAEIAEVILTLKVVSVGAPVPSLTKYSLHRVLKPWIEGTGAGGNNGSLARTNEPTWNRRAAPDTPWTQPGALAGSDFEATASASQAITDEVSFDLSSTNLIGDVQSWIANPGANFGWIILSDREGVSQSARRFGSREDTNNSPVLSIGYVLPKTEFKIEGPDLIPSYLILHLDLEEDTAYSLQYRPAFGKGSWQVLTNFPAEPFFRHYVFPDPFLTNQNRFYRMEIKSP